MVISKQSITVDTNKVLMKLIEAIFQESWQITAIMVTADEEWQQKL